jgi:hypothetical protein
MIKEYLEWQLSGVHKEKLAEWYDIFNKWNWPKDFSIEREPKDWNEISSYCYDMDVRSKYTLTKEYRDAIEKIIGKKECVRYHHIHNLHIKNYQFEIWWLVWKFNGFIIRKFDTNLYFDIYGFMNWRMTY